MQPSVLSSMPYRVVARGSEDKTCEIGLLQLRGTTLTNGQSRRWFVACRTVFGRAGSHARQQHVVCTWLVFFCTFGQKRTQGQNKHSPWRWTTSHERYGRTLTLGYGAKSMLRQEESHRHHQPSMRYRYTKCWQNTTEKDYIFHGLVTKQHLQLRYMIEGWINIQNKVDDCLVAGFDRQEITYLCLT